MDIEVLSFERLHFADGAPVTSASAVVPFGDGFLVVPDDATHAAWFRDDSVTAVRMLPPVDGLELFTHAMGTKHLKPDFEAACQVTVGDAPAALVLGSGSSPTRTRWSLLRLDRDEPRADVADMTPLYTTVAAALSVTPADLNLEGACVVGEWLRWCHRGLPAAGLPSGSVDLELATAVAAALGQVDPGAVEVTRPRTYDCGIVGMVGLAVTDAVAIPGGALLASVAAEDSPNPRDDGPVVGSGLVRIEDELVTDIAPLPLFDDEVIKVEGLMVLEADEDQAELLAVVDVDDPAAASLATRLRVRL